MTPALEAEIPIQIERGLYAAGEHGLLERLRALEDGVESVLLIAHNPGLERLAFSLASGGQAVGRHRAQISHGALATLEFACRWRDLGAGTAELTDFVTPKELAKR